MKADTSQQSLMTQSNIAFVDSNFMNVFADGKSTLVDITNLQNTG